MTDAYNPATRPCSGHAMFGATTLQHAILGHWPHATDVGVYACRPTADGAPSVHGNGRAGDVGPGQDPCAVIAVWLVANHTTLGVQLVIYNHHIWNVSRKDEGWRPYGCDKPGSKKDHHTGHIHWEINDDAAARLTPGIVASTFPANPQPEDEDMAHKIWRPVGAGSPNVGGEYVELGDTFIILSANEKQQLANSETNGDPAKLHVQDAQPELWKRITQDYTKVVT